MSSELKMRNAQCALTNYLLPAASCLLPAELQSRFLSQFVGFVSMLPGEIRIIAAKVPVAGGLLENRSQQLEVADHVSRLETEGITHYFHQPLRRELAGAEGIYHQAHRLCHSDAIGNLNLALVCQPGCNNVLGRVAGHVGAAPVHLGRVLAGKATATVTALAAVGIHDNLASS